MTNGSPVFVPLDLSLHGRSTACDAERLHISVFEVCSLEEIAKLYR